jgi:hypothetical protein
LPDLNGGFRVTMCFPRDGMYYNDSSRRLNLLSGLVFGTVLGAGLALLFVPERVGGGRRVVVRAAKAVRRTARGGAEAARERLEGVRTRLGEHRRRREPEPEAEPATAFGRARGLARRKFEL